MLKARGYASGISGLLRFRGARPASNVSDDQLLMNAVIKSNPQFKRLDGVLIGLADSCMSNGSNASRARVTGVCSSITGEGKTTIAIGLATAIARRSASKVLLLEADLTTPTMKDDLDLSVSEGLTDCLRGDKTWEKVVQPSLVDHLSVMTAGEATGNPLSLLEGPELETLFTALRGNFRHIVVDMPPILEREDASRLVGMVDKVIYLIGAGKVSQDLVTAGITAVGRHKIMGAVLNGAWKESPEWLSRVITTEPEPAAASSR